jgi:hypothetical protein
MRPQEEVALGAECAWPVPPKSSAAERAGLALVAVLLVVGAWMATPRLGIERYVLAGAANKQLVEILDRRDLWVIKQAGAIKQAGPTRLTLITCYPFDAMRAGGGKRYVLLAFLS